MDNYKILLIARYEGKLLCRNFVFLLLCGFMSLGIVVFHVFLQSDWRVFEYSVNLPSGMPYANAYLWGIMQSFLVIFVVGDFVSRDNIEKTNDVFLARDFSNLEYLTGKLVGVVFVLLGFLTGWLYWLPHQVARETRNDWVTIQKKYDAYPKVKIAQHEIRYDIRGEKILARSVISVRNSNSFRVDSVIF